MNKIKYDPSRFGPNLRKLRMQSPLSAKDFAAKCGIHIQTLNQICHSRGRPSLRTMCLILNAFDMTLEELLQ